MTTEVLAEPKWPLSLYNSALQQPYSILTPHTPLPAPQIGILHCPLCRCQPCLWHTGPQKKAVLHLLQRSRPSPPLPSPSRQAAAAETVGGPAGKPFQSSCICLSSYIKRTRPGSPCLTSAAVQ